MARQARIVIPNEYHHISQRSVDGTRIFFDKEDFQTYHDIVREQSSKKGLTIFSYCYFPNQIHLLCKPQQKNDLAVIIGEINRQYTRYFNQKNNRQGSVFNSRFFSYPVDEPYALRAARFIETLPVSRVLTDKAQNYLWSSAKHRIKNIHDNFIHGFQNFHALQNWEEFLNRPMDVNEMKTVQTHLQTGRPRGNDLFLDMIEGQIGRTVRPKKRGRKSTIQKAA